MPEGRAGEAYPGAAALKQWSRRVGNRAGGDRGDTISGGPGS